MKTIQHIMDRLHNPNLGALLLRIALGLVFINAGWIKLHMISAMVEGFGSLGIAAGLAYFVVAAEFVGGILLILGLWTRYVSFVLAIIMLVAILKVHLMNGYGLQNNGYEYVLTLFLTLVALITSGEGKYSVQRLFKGNTPTA